MSQRLSGSGRRPRVEVDQNLKFEDKDISGLFSSSASYAGSQQNRGSDQL